MEERDNGELIGFLFFCFPMRAIDVTGATAGAAAGTTSATGATGAQQAASTQSQPQQEEKKKPSFGATSSPSSDGMKTRSYG